MSAGAGLAAGEIASNISPEQIKALGEEADDQTLNMALLGVGGIAAVGVGGYLLFKYLNPAKWFKEGFEGLANALKGGADWVWGQTTGFFDSAGNFISGGLSDIGGFFGDVGSGLGDIGSDLKFWRIIYEDTTLVVKKDGEVISGETAKMTYVFKDGSGLVSEGTLERENEMKIPSNVEKLIVEVPSKDFKETIKFE